MKTEIKIWPVDIQVNGNTKVLAYVSLTLDQKYDVNGLRVMETKKNGNENLWVAFPSKRIKGDFRTVFFPVTAEAREKLIEAIIKEYRRSLKLEA